MGILICKIKLKFNIIQIQIKKKQCLDEAKEEKDWEREELNVIAKFFEITSKVSPNRHPSIGKKRRSETYFRFDLRRNPRSFESVFGKCHQRRCDLHRTCQAEDSNSHGRRLRFETSRKNSLRIWWINRPLILCPRTIKRNITTFLSVLF